MLYEWLDVESLTTRDRYAQHARPTFDAVLELSERIATDQFATHNRLSDSHEPILQDGTVRLIPEIKVALEVFARTGLIGASMDESVGGMQLPHVVTSACFAWFQAANIATSAYPFLTVANANLLLTYGTPAQIESYVLPMVEGRFFGTMCLSEPQAGSSLADITTRAEPQRDGTYRLIGQQDVDLRRRPRAQREHRAPGAGQDPGRPARRQGHLAVHRPEVPLDDDGNAGRAQRRRAGRPQPQDGLPRHRQHAAELRRRHIHRPAARPEPSATSSASRTRAWPTCST